MKSYLSGPVTLIKKSIDIFIQKENFLYFLKIYLILIPFTIYFFFQDQYIQQIVGKTTSIGGPLYAFLTGNQFKWLIGPVIVINLAYLIISFWITAAGIAAVSNIVNGKTIKIKEVLAFAWKKLWLFSILNILLTLMLGFGGLLILIPGIIFYVWYSYSKFVFMDQEAGVIVSFGRSRNLVKGRFWQVFGRMIVFTIFALLVEIVLSFIPLGLGSVIHPIFEALFILPNYLLYKELTVQPGL